MKYRLGKTLFWWPTDTQKNYKKINNFGPNLYKPYEFTYAYNSHGFRCDEFSLESDIPIIFTGCSVTEGIGIPLNQVWAYNLITKIRNTTNKNIPYWNLSVPGTGIDTMAYYLYQFTRIKKVKYIFAYFPEFSRRDYAYAGNLSCWAAGWKTTDDCKINTLFIDDSFIDHQTERSLMLIDSIRGENDAIMLSSKWGRQESMFNRFPKLNLFNKDIQIVDIARDSIHSGPTYHSDLADEFWLRCRHHFE